MNTKQIPTCVLTLETHRLNNADLHHFIAALGSLCNSRGITDAGADAVLELLNSAEAEYYRRQSKTPLDALRKVLLLAGDGQ